MRPSWLLAIAPPACTPTVPAEILDAAGQATIDFEALDPDDGSGLAGAIGVFEWVEYLGDPAADPDRVAGVSWVEGGHLQPLGSASGISS